MMLAQGQQFESHWVRTMLFNPGCTLDSPVSCSGHSDLTGLGQGQVHSRFKISTGDFNE